jgi:hypothetical protein
MAKIDNREYPRVRRAGVEDLFEGIITRVPRSVSRCMGDFLRKF